MDSYDIILACYVLAWAGIIGYVMTLPPSTPYPEGITHNMIIGGWQPDHSPAAG